MQAVFTGFDSAWGMGNSGAICDLALQKDGSLQLDAAPVAANWDQALRRAKQDKGLDLRIWAIDQPLCVRNEAGCRRVDRDLGRALMGPCGCGAYPANLGNPCWARGARIWDFLRVLEDNNYAHNPMAVPGARAGRYYFECYPHPALLGLFDLDRIIKYKVRHKNADEWARLVRLLRSLATPELPIRNICDFVDDRLAHSKGNEDKVDAIISAYAAAYWWRFGVSRSTLIGDLSSGYIVTPHSKRTYAALAEIFSGRMNSQGTACAPPREGEPSHQVDPPLNSRRMRVRDGAGDSMPAEPRDDWSEPVELVATDNANLWRNLRGVVTNRWVDAARMTGWCLWVRFINEDGEPAVLFEPFRNQGENQGGMRAGRQQANLDVWRSLVAGATGNNPVRSQVRYRYEQMQPTRWGQGFSASQEGILTLNKVSFALVIHSHQPVGNFDHVIEEAYQRAYAPFVQVLLQHPRVRLSLHYSGILLEWMEQRHPEFFDQLRELSGRGQVELLGGGYYEPILPSIPDADKISQVRKLADYLYQHWGTAPRGAWVAERVWEPSLARPLAQAGVEYVVLDDTHFLAAGLEPARLHGIYVTEEQGAPLRLVPSLKSLRYTIPFQEPEETLRILRKDGNYPGQLFAMGDDCEKFGVWPGTYDHVYQKGWLKRFLEALEGAGEWLETTTVSDYIASHASLGRVYLPTASYAEMMEWALPTATSAELRACLDETEKMPDGERFRRFLQAGFWRNFLSKYPESNQIQKLMSAVSRRWQELSGARPPEEEEARLLSEAQSHVLASQCNDGYWHGVFGGLYAPHLRNALFRHLIRAEVLLDKVEGLSGNPSLRVKREDFDVDGHEEVLLEHPAFGMIIRPADGGTVSSLRFKPAEVELVNSLMRRPEAYHAMVRKHVGSKEPPKEGPASIHDMVLSKEANLEALLRYDRYARHMFRTYVFSAVKGWRDFSLLRLDENEVLACGPWKQSAGRTLPNVVRLENSAPVVLGDCVMQIEARKTLTTKVQGDTCRIECKSSLSAGQPCPAKTALGTELVINLLAPAAPDRYFVASGVRRPLDFRGEIDASNLTLVDEWQRVKISLEAQPRPRWWIVPIETISQSELGFERVYQGSAILAVWKIDPASWRDVTGVLRVEVAPWAGPALDDDNG